MKAKTDRAGDLRAPVDHGRAAARLAAEYPGMPRRVIEAALAESSRTVERYGQGLDEQMLVEAIARHHLDAAAGQVPGPGP